jgi:type VI secretion system protein ImpC
MSELLDAIITQAQFAEDDEGQPKATGVVHEFVERVASEAEGSTKGAAVGISEAIAQIDAEISKQLSEIMHHEKFQNLEGSWTGLNSLVNNTECSSRLRLRAFCATADELVKDLTTAVEFDQSHLFKQLYETEYGSFGGSPYSMIVLDHEFTAGNKDMSFMREMAGVAAACHAPLVTSAGAKFFGMDDYTQLSNPRDMSRVLDSSEYAKWRSFRETEESRYVALTLPRVLARVPYGPDGMPVDGVDFVESVDGTDANDFVWTSAAWKLAERVTNAFAQHGWTSAIRGVEGGGLVQNLPAYNFKTTAGEMDLVCPTETPITDRREKELSDLGFLPLVHCRGTDTAAFFGGQTANKAKTYDDDDASSNALLSSRLPYIFAASRFAHYFKVMLRDKVGSFETADSVQNFLQSWVSNYILLDDNGSHLSKAKFPLREARVDVREVPGSPGAYTAIAYLRPHFQLEEVDASIRLVANLPAPAA